MRPNTTPTRNYSQPPSALATSTEETAKAAANVVAAKERVERLRKGEDVSGGFTKPPTTENLARILREAGIDPVDCARVNELASV